MVRGKVARILSETQLVLNVGANHGVEHGMTFIIFEEGEDVTDPDSGESLGLLEWVKAEVVVSHVQESLSIAESKVIEDVNPTSVLSERLAQLDGGVTTSKREQLHVRRSQMAGLPSFSPISVGDSVRSRA